MFFSTRLSLSEYWFLMFIYAFSLGFVCRVSGPPLNQSFSFVIRQDRPSFYYRRSARITKNSSCEILADLSRDCFASRRRTLCLISALNPAGSAAAVYTSAAVIHDLMVHQCAYILNPVYTMQPVVQPAVQPVVQPVASYIRSFRLTSCDDL